MKLRCNNGDLAIIIQDYPGCERNIGRVVTVRGPFKLQTEDGPTWLIYPECPEPWTYLSNFGDYIVTRLITTINVVEHPDAWLLPLRPQDESKWIAYAATDESPPKKLVVTFGDFYLEAIRAKTAKTGGKSKFYNDSIGSQAGEEPKSRVM